MVLLALFVDLLDPLELGIDTNNGFQTKIDLKNLYSLQIYKFDGVFVIAPLRALFLQSFSSFAKAQTMTRMAFSIRSSR